MRVAPRASFLVCFFNPSATCASVASRAGKLISPYSNYRTNIDCDGLRSFCYLTGLQKIGTLGPWAIHSAFKAANSFGHTIQDNTSERRGSGRRGQLRYLNPCGSTSIRQARPKYQSHAVSNVPYLAGMAVLCWSTLVRCHVGCFALLAGPCRTY